MLRKYRAIESSGYGSGEIYTEHSMFKLIPIPFNQIISLNNRILFTDWPKYKQEISGITALEVTINNDSPLFPSNSSGVIPYSI